VHAGVINQARDTDAVAGLWSVKRYREQVAFAEGLQLQQSYICCFVEPGGTAVRVRTLSTPLPFMSSSFPLLRLVAATEDAPKFLAIAAAARPTDVVPPRTSSVSPCDSDLLLSLMFFSLI